MFCFFDPKACGTLAPQPGIEPTTPAVEGEVLTTGLPGKSLRTKTSKSQSCRDRKQKKKVAIGSLGVIVRAANP